MSSNYWEGFICPVCGEGFTLKQWEKRHNGKNGEEYHEECCPECKDDIAYLDENGSIPEGWEDNVIQ
jgi:uncharacterized Zn finger protein (UPF0148 family)